MKIALASLAAFSLIAAAPAGAAARPEGQPAVSSDTQASAGKDERKTCRRFDNSARRTTAVKLCLTKEEWKKFDAEQE